MSLVVLKADMTDFFLQNSYSVRHKILIFVTRFELEIGHTTYTIQYAACRLDLRKY